MQRNKLLKMATVVAAAWLAVVCGGTARAQQKIQAEVVTLRDGGFSPAQISRPAGQFLLVVKNRSHAAKVSLGITALDLSTVAPVQDFLGVGKDYMLTLTASTYVLKDSAHPTWTPLTIVVH